MDYVLCNMANENYMTGYACLFVQIQQNLVKIYLFSYLLCLMPSFPQKCFPSICGARGAEIQNKIANKYKRHTT